MDFTRFARIVIPAPVRRTIVGTYLKHRWRRISSAVFPIEVVPPTFASEQTERLYAEMWERFMAAEP